MAGTVIAAGAALPPPGESAVDPVGSSVGFGIVELFVNNVRGKFTTFDAKVVVGDSIASSRVAASVEVATVDTGVKMRDEHLRRVDYFNVASIPKMTFASTVGREVTSAARAGLGLFGVIGAFYVLRAMDSGQHRIRHLPHGRGGVVALRRHERGDDRFEVTGTT